MVTFTHDSPESWVAYNERVLGPAIMAKTALEPQGRWEDLKAELTAMYADGNESTDGTWAASAEYLVTLAQMPA